MEALALNFRDLLVVQGLYNRTMPLPLVPVSDGAGVIVARGDAAMKFDEGARVMPIHVSGWTAGRGEPDGAPRGGPNPGVAAEFVVFDQRDLVAAPEHLDGIEAATLPCAAVTAWNGLFGEEAILPGQRVLILGTGGVALFALQFAKLAGAEVAITSKDDAKLARARAMGADHLVNYHADENWGSTVRELFAGEGADVVVELGGARTLAQSLRAVRRGGTVALIGSVTGAEVEKLALPPVFMRNVTMAWGGGRLARAVRGHDARNHPAPPAPGRRSRVPRPRRVRSFARISRRGQPLRQGRGGVRGVTRPGFFAFSDWARDLHAQVAAVIAAEVRPGQRTYDEQHAA